ncbi:MAG: hypothetical protein E6J72_01460 [Deltaproteobacteria bacterium]|nr:MAG: hypothetical protein E6J72_01460 [Deltaproteobacteria bacterium]
MSAMYIRPWASSAMPRRPINCADEDDEPGHAGERGIGVGRDRAVDVLHSRAWVDAQDPAVHVGDVHPALGVERHAQEAHQLRRLLSRYQDRIGAGLHRVARIEAERPDLVARIEEPVETRVRGGDVQGPSVHREAARVAGVTESREHLDVADRARR